LSGLDKLPQKKIKFMEICRIWKNFHGLPITKFASTLCLMTTYRLSWATDLTTPASYCQAAGAIFEVTIFFFESYYILKSYVH
jgi:hypothetical protein